MAHHELTEAEFELAEDAAIEAMSAAYSELDPELWPAAVKRSLPLGFRLLAANIWEDHTRVQFEMLSMERGRHITVTWDPDNLSQLSGVGDEVQWGCA